ncbi:MAG: hypothetical protein DMG38_11055 [Acidobacteria bacterium]|nr:MAG: hypothetical protein DMG38_11055 [Acidobacteriota bacterium]
MRKPALAPIALLFLTAPGHAAAQSAVSAPGPAVVSEPSRLLDHVIANQKKDEAALEVYECMERLESRKNPNDSAPASVKITRVIPSGTGMDKIPVDPDGKPADLAAYRSRLESLEHALALIVNNNRTQRDAVEKYAKKKKERNDLIDAARNAFLFTFVAREPRGDRILAKYEMAPNPAFKPTSRFTSIFTRVHGYVWIDEDAAELARVEGDVTEDISIGLFLGKIYKGSHFMQERYEVQPGLWQPSFTQYDFDGRKLFSGFSIHERAFYSNYRYIGPPKEAIEAIQKELALADWNKSSFAAADP